MKKSNMAIAIIGLAVSLFLATFLSPFASSSPDGLERVAEDKGFLDSSEVEGITLWESSPMPDYAFPGIENTRFSTGVAGLFGTIFIFVVSFLFGKIISRKKQLERSSE